MKAYSELSREELMELREQLLAAYEEKKALGLNLDMSRGKPSPTQLGVSVGLMEPLRIISSSVVTQVSLLCLTLYQEHIHME